MKRKFLLLFMLIATLANSTKAQLTCYGGSSYNPSTLTYTMTDPSTCLGGWVATAAWNNSSTLNFFSSFTLDFDTRFTTIPGQYPADGICAVFGNYVNNPATGSLNHGAGYLGYYNLSGGTHNPDFDHSIAVEMDIYNNGSSISQIQPDPSYDHLLLTKNGDIDFAYPSGAVKIDPLTPIVSDGLWRHMRIEWDCATETLKVYCNGNLRLSEYVDKWNFDDPFHVRWGFTAGVGSGCATQEIRNPVMAIGTDCTGGPLGSPCGYIDLNWSYAGTRGGNCLFNVSVLTAPAPGYTLSPVNPYSYEVSNPYLPPTWGPLPSTVIESTPGTAVFGFQTLRVCVKFRNIATQEDCILCITKRITCENGLGGSIYKPGNTTSVAQTSPGENKITLYPNPASDHLTIDCSKDILGASYILKDITGKQLQTGIISTSGQIIRIDELPKGVYILQISQQGLQVRNIKFTKQL